MTREVTHPAIQVVQVDVTKYQNPWYQSRHKKKHFELWYRSAKALALLKSAAPSMLAASDKWFEENNIEEGAICGKVRKHQ